MTRVALVARRVRRDPAGLLLPLVAERAAERLRAEGGLGRRHRAHGGDVRVARGEHQDADLLDGERCVAAARVGKHEPRRKRARRVCHGVHGGNILVRALLERSQQLERTRTPCAWLYGLYRGRRVACSANAAAQFRRRRDERGGERLDGIHEPRRVRHRRALRDGSQLRDGGGDDLRVVSQIQVCFVILRSSPRIREQHRAEHGDLLAGERGVSPRALHGEVPVAVRALERPAQVKGQRAVPPPRRAERREPRARARAATAPPAR